LGGDRRLGLLLAAVAERLVVLLRLRLGAAGEDGERDQGGQKTSHETSSLGASRMGRAAGHLLSLRRTEVMTTSSSGTASCPLGAFSIVLTFLILSTTSMPLITSPNTA